MFWIFILLFFAVIGAKYYTALGTRNIERRLNRIKSQLDEARERLRQERDSESSAGKEEELQELRVRFMKELIQDIHMRMSQSDPEPASRSLDDRDDAVSAAFRF